MSTAKQYNLAGVPQIPNDVRQRVIYGVMTTEDEAVVDQTIAEATAILRSRYQANPSGLARELSKGHLRRLRAQARKARA